jgi:hypothetical protein
VVEVLGVKNGFLQSSFVLGMAKTCSDSGVINIVKGVLPQKTVADNSKTF